MVENNRNSKADSPPGSKQDSPPGSGQGPPQGPKGSFGFPIIRWISTGQQSGGVTRINYSAYDEQGKNTVQQSIAYNQPILYKALTGPPGGTSEFPHRSLAYNQPILYKAPTDSPGGTSEFPRHSIVNDMPILHRALIGQPGGTSEFPRHSIVIDMPRLRQALTSQPVGTSEYQRLMPILHTILADQSRNPVGQSNTAALQGYGASFNQFANPHHSHFEYSRLLKALAAAQQGGNFESHRQIFETLTNEFVGVSRPERVSRPEPRANSPDILQEPLPGPLPETSNASPQIPVKEGLVYYVKKWLRETFGKRRATSETGNSSTMQDPPGGPVKKPKQD